MDHSNQTTTDIRNILFYKYVNIDDPVEFRKDHLELCRSLNLLGKVLVAKEGINGCLSGSVSDTDKYMEIMKKDSRFSDIEFKEGLYEKHTFKRMLVKVRKEIIALNLEKDVDMSNKAPYIEPKDFKKLLDSDEEIIVIDARNDYESEYGHFAGAITPDIETFRQWPTFVKSIEHLKDKKIITYCTGGIRCEKASAYLVEKGFENVQQLRGGIIKYGEECGNNHWEGKCFVFDHRGVVNIDPALQEPEKQCSLCYLPAKEKNKCVECGATFLSCTDCCDILMNCCSKFCRGKVKQKIFKGPASDMVNAE